MKLVKFRVTNFRSIVDSTWIDCGNVTNIIGINEAGKSNALLALWKLKPASEGKINILEDLPRNKYSDLKDSCGDMSFIQAYFQFEATDADLLHELAALTNHQEDEMELVYIERCYNGDYSYKFPNEKHIDSISSTELQPIVSENLSAIQQISVTGTKEPKYKSAIIKALEEIENSLNNTDTLNSNELDKIISTLSIKEHATTQSQIKPLVDTLYAIFKNKIDQLKNPPIHHTPELFNKIYNALPSFVYYSNYGNLDSEIYLPHVIDNLKRTDITGIAAAKARTLRVLFEFINLDPKEILELGNDGQNLSSDEVAKLSRKKAERTVLLNSASSKLTKEFRKWWKQGNYIFDLRADGKFFKIWVSDDKRPEKVSLESRSTGLQWFLSFYLIFLVETKSKLKNSILLLDEAGLSLHPLAQKDLLNFFRGLAETNQIIHTTHSPFLVDTDNIDNVKIAYIDDEGHTVLSNNLRANTDPRHDTSIYAVHAALGLSVSDILLNGCLPVIVEGPSDQYYLSAIKTYLISTGKIQPKKEIIFMPAGGVKGVSAIASIISSNDELPFVILDSDNMGISFKNKLLKELYKEIPEKIISVGDIRQIERAEIEDIIPFKCITKAIDKLFKDADEFDFEEAYDEDKPLIPQLEEAAKKQNIQLPNSYKVDLAKAAKNKILKLSKEPNELNLWLDIFKKIQ